MDRETMDAYLNIILDAMESAPEGTVSIKPDTFYLTAPDPGARGDATKFIQFLLAVHVVFGGLLDEEALAFTPGRGLIITLPNGLTGPIASMEWMPGTGE
jgi:hypothetical protein